MEIQVQYYEILDSTNEMVVRLARQGAPEGTVVVAKEQRNGHGQRQRQWKSPAGGLWFSILLRPKIEPSCAAQITLLAGVAAATALRRLYQTDRIFIKWPNDLLIGSKKISGILSEMRLSEQGDIDYIVVGIGVNVNLPAGTFTRELRDTAVSLNFATGKKNSCNEVLNGILEEMTALYEPWQRRGAEAILPMWRDLNCTLARDVIVKDEDKIIFAGRAVSISDTGALEVQNEAGSIRRFDFGEVSIRST